MPICHNVDKDIFLTFMTALLSCLWSVPTTTSPLVVTHEPTTWARSSKTEWKNEKIYPEKILKK